MIELRVMATVYVVRLQVLSLTMGIVMGWLNVQRSLNLFSASLSLHGPSGCPFGKFSNAAWSAVEICGKNGTHQESKSTTLCRCAKLRSHQTRPVNFL